MKSNWKEFINELDIEVTFLHKDEFLEEFQEKISEDMDFPTALIHYDSDLKSFIFVREMNELENLEE
ncbi:MAG: hypothetical protein GF329_22690 [Candidatus Lokiarchaeota archaeon]|nr:hypothetical protein [Candidatus Lokiarchaeota archaeon]